MTLAGGKYVALSIEVDPCDRMAGGLGDLAEKRALGKLGRVAQVQKVAQHVGAGIDVWIGGHGRNVSRVPASRLRSCGHEQLTERLASAYQTRRVI